MPNFQDSNWPLRSIVNETGDNWNFFQAPVTVDITSFTLNQAQQDPLTGVSQTDFVWLSVQKLSPDSTTFQAQLSPGDDNSGDSLLFSAVTQQGDPIQANLDGSPVTQIPPVVSLINIDYNGQNVAPLQATLLVNVIDFNVTYDPPQEGSMGVYHLWYYVNVYTSRSKTNNYSLNGTMSPCAVKTYSVGDATSFNLNDWFVIPQRGLRNVDMQSAHRVLLHAKGHRYLLKSGSIELPYLVVDEPEIESHWPLTDGYCQQADSFVVQLIGFDEATNIFSWTEQSPISANQWQAKVNGRTGGVGSFPAYEANNSHVEIPCYVRLYPYKMTNDATICEYRFWYRPRIEFVMVTSVAPVQGNFYAGIVQRFNPSTGVWDNMENCLIMDANA